MKKLILLLTLLTGVLFLNAQKKCTHALPHPMWSEKEMEEILSVPVTDAPTTVVLTASEQQDINATYKTSIATINNPVANMPVGTTVSNARYTTTVSMQPVPLTRTTAVLSTTTVHGVGAPITITTVRYTIRQ